MILQNNTRLPDDALRAVLSAAREAVKARSSGVFVQVNQGFRCKGVPHNCGQVRWGRNARWTRCQGAFKITAPLLNVNRDPLEMAESFFSIAAHEWSHIRDYQDMAAGDDMVLIARPGASGRRPPHDSRPEERRASSRQADADSARERCADQILALALAIEESREKPI